MSLTNKCVSSRLMLVLLASMVGMTMSAAESKSRPQLVVGIMVDGLERDYIDLLRDYFGEGGFRRLLRDGVMIANTDYGTPLDATAATAMLMTGAAPSVNGISEAFTYDVAGRRSTPVLLDNTSIGNFTNETYSPRNLLTSTLADEVRIAGGGVTQVYAVAPDPQVAIALGGHAANCAMWISDANGNWATTTFYKDVPAVVTGRNRLTPLASRLDTLSWTPVMKPADYPNLPDHLKHYPFRYVFPRGTQRYEIFKNAAPVNAEVTSVATDIIDNLKLGTHDGVDMVNVAYALRPYGYSKNPDTRFELMDSYLRLDRELEKLFNTVDRSTAGGNAVIFLAATPPGLTSRRDDEQWNIPYGEFSTRKAGSLLNMYLMAVYGDGEWVSGYHKGRFFLNDALIKQKNLDPKTVRTAAAAFVARMSGIKDVYTIDQIFEGDAGPNSEALKRNITLATAGDLVLSVLPGWEVVDDYHNEVSPKRVSRVHRISASTAPAFILAPDVKPQKIHTPVDVRVIAPTVARLLRIRSPNGASLPALELD